MTFVASDTKATDTDSSNSASSQCPLQPSELTLPSFPQQPTLPQFLPQATATLKFFSQPNAVQSIPEAAKQINPSGNSPLTPSGNSQFAHWTVSTPNALSKDSPLMQSEDITCISSDNSPCQKSDSSNVTSSPVISPSKPLTTTQCSWRKEHQNTRYGLPKERVHRRSDGNSQRSQATTADHI